VKTAMKDDLIKKVRRIELNTRRLMNDLMGGEYKSRFKGQGVQFSEHRVYSPGDDIRHLDWKVTARSKEPLIKQYEEERELNVLIIADLSASGSFGSKSQVKRELVSDLGSMIAYAASFSGDKVGALLVTDQVQKVIPLRKGRNHALRIIRDLVSTPSEPGGTALKEALEEALKIMKQSGIVFVISDFIAADYEAPLKRIGKKHDLVVVPIRDTAEQHLPLEGFLYFEDPETGVTQFIDSTRKSVRDAWIDESQAQLKQQSQFFTAAKASVLTVYTNEDYAETLVRFLKKRKGSK
jgi:uncharacterized protein (DUF58 family)